MRYYGGQPVDMGNAGAMQAQLRSPLYTTPLAPVWGGGPLVPGTVPGRESFLGPAPAQRYKMSSEMGSQPLGSLAGPGQLSTDVIQANMPGPSNEQLLSQGIPVGQDPRFPMDQKMFEAYVEERRFKNKYPNPGDFRRFVDQYNKSYFPGSQATLPADIGGKTVY